MRRMLLLAGAMAVMATGCRQAPPPMPPVAAQTLGEAQRAYSRQRFAEALALADSAAALAPQAPDPLFLKGRVLTDLNRFDAARAAFRAVLERDPEYRSARYHLGQVAFLQANYRDAVAWYQQELDALGRGEPAARAAVVLQQGRAYALLSVPDSAEAAYRQALRLDSTSARAHAWMAELAAAQGALDDALTHARQALRLDLEDEEARYLVGSLLVRTGRPEAALAPLEAVVRRRPWHEGAHYNLGRALLALGHEGEGNRHLALADSLQTLNAAIALAQLGTFQYPEDPARWGHLATVLQQAGRRAEAARALRIARALRSAADDGRP
ncbi:MAG: tetratricopeptide repeat protein [Rhodothermales bacterium]|nr:tetratricopeptide repeat protein [Rhodothermales bacterium]